MKSPIQTSISASDIAGLLLMASAPPAALEIIGALHQHGVEFVGNGRRYGSCIMGRMDPVLAGERNAELLELPDGCSGLRQKTCPRCNRRGWVRATR